MASKNCSQGGLRKPEISEAFSDPTGFWQYLANYVIFAELVPNVVWRVDEFGL